MEVTQGNTSKSIRPEKNLKVSRTKIAKSNESIHNDRRKRIGVANLVCRLFGKKNADQQNHNQESSLANCASLNGMRLSKERLPFSRRHSSSNPEVRIYVDKKHFRTSTRGMSFSNLKLSSQNGHGLNYNREDGNCDSCDETSQRGSSGSTTEICISSKNVKLDEEIGNLSAKKYATLEKVNGTFEIGTQGESQLKPSDQSQDNKMEVHEKTSKLRQNMCFQNASVSSASENVFTKHVPGPTVNPLTLTQFEDYLSNSVNQVYNSEKVLLPGKSYYKTVVHMEVKPWGVEVIGKQEVQMSPVSKHEKNKAFRQITGKCDESVAIGIPWTPGPVTNRMSAQRLYVSSFVSIPHPQSAHCEHSAAQFPHTDLVSTDSMLHRNPATKRKRNLSIVNYKIDAEIMESLQFERRKYGNIVSHSLGNTVTSGLESKKKPNSLSSILKNPLETQMNLTSNTFEFTSEITQSEKIKNPSLLRNLISEEKSRLANTGGGDIDLKIPYYASISPDITHLPSKKLHLRRSYSATSKLKSFTANTEIEFSTPAEVSMHAARLAHELTQEISRGDTKLALFAIAKENSIQKADDESVEIYTPGVPWENFILENTRKISSGIFTEVPELSSPGLVRELSSSPSQESEAEVNNCEHTTGSDENPNQKLGSVMDSSEEVKRALQVVEVDIHRNNVHFDSVPPMNGIPSTENGLADPSTESVTAGKLSNTQNVTQTQAMTSETNSNHKEREIPKTCPSTPSTTPITKKPFADSLIENGDPRISLTPMRNVEESELVISTESHDSDGPLSPGYDVSNRRQSSESFTDSFKHLQPFNFNLGAIHEGKRERLYKVLVVGELGTGKTSIIKRYVHQFFSQHYRATIGVDFALKVLRWDPETVVRLQLWDIAGQERFGSMTRVYYKEAVGAFVVFDVTRSGTLDAVQKWKNDLDSKVVLPDGRPIPTVLLANKSDQPKEGMAANREKMNEFCKQNGFAAWFETSAKENIHIDEAASFLVSKILEMDRWSQEPMARDPEKLNLGMNGKYKPSDGSLKNCAC